ncbi:SCF ubiquitin ligase complex subunit [Maudiozyma humilis]|uniref:SCF ubiquitin ligase complex subunit n=1 Tax=Maudiozyma humilis TaxID=51915 RepID=A0AAV5S0F4_MAUHU|nr:SCF ubiquitin ligase complex subunit [Kazachstania humilis]
MMTQETPETVIRHPVTLEDFPLEVWLQVAAHLTTADLLTLRGVSKKVARGVSQRHIWKERCQERWLGHLALEEEVFREPSFLRRSYESDDDDWCRRFRRSLHAENHICRRVERLACTQSMAEYSSRFDIVLKNKRDTLLPVMASLVNPPWITDPTLLLEDGRYDIYTTSLQLLLNLRHERVFKLLWCTSPALDLDSTNLEPLFLELAMMDPAYDRLLPHVLRVRQQVMLEVLGPQLTLDDFNELPMATRVRRICTAMFRSFKGGIPTTRHWEPREHIYNEDLMLPRIYAGETIGHLLLHLVILQSLCRMFGIETVLTEFHLIVESEEEEDDEILLGIPPGRKEPVLYTRESLARSLARQSGVDQSAIAQQVLPGMLAPLTTTRSCNVFFQELVQQSVGSVATHTNSENARVIQFDWAEHATRFATSRCPLLDSTLRYFAEAHAHVRDILQDLVDEPVAAEFQTIKRSRHYNPLLRLTKRLAPWDCSHVFSQGIVTDRMTYLTWLQEYCKAVITPEDIRDPETRLGTLAVFNRTEYVCIVSSEYLRHGTPHVTCLRATGEFLVERVRDLDYKRVPPRETLAYFGVMAAPTGSLGLFFSSLHESESRFLLNDRILAFGTKQAESPGGVVAFDEHNKPVLG